MWKINDWKKHWGGDVPLLLAGRQPTANSTPAALQHLFL